MQHHEACMRIDALNRKLEKEAAEAYHKHGDELRKCCGRQPFYYFDSHGMPTTTIKCLECGRKIVGKFWVDAAPEWNKLFET